MSNCDYIRNIKLAGALQIPCPHQEDPNSSYVWLRVLADNLVINVWFGGNKRRLTLS